MAEPWGVCHFFEEVFLDFGKKGHLYNLRFRFGGWHNMLGKVLVFIKLGKIARVFRDCVKIGLVDFC